MSKNEKKKEQDVKGGAFAKYNKLLSTYPYLVNGIQAVIISTLAIIASSYVTTILKAMKTADPAPASATEQISFAVQEFQLLLSGKTSVAIPMEDIMIMGVINFCYMTPLILLFAGFLTNVSQLLGAEVVDKEGKPKGLTKTQLLWLNVFIDQVLFSPFFTAGIIALRHYGYVGVNDWHAFKTSLIPLLREVLPSALLYAWCFWIPVKYFMFSSVPPIYQLLVANLFAFVWNIIFTLILAVGIICLTLTKLNILYRTFNRPTLYSMTVTVNNPSAKIPLESFPKMSDKDSGKDILPLGEIANPVNTEEGPFATDDSKTSVPVPEKSSEPLQQEEKRQEEEKPNDIEEGLVVNDESRVSMTVPAGSMSRQEEQEEEKTKDIEERFSGGDDYCRPSTATPVESTEPPAQVEVKGSEKPKDTEEGLLVDDESRISITSAENREPSKQEKDEEKESEEKPVVIEAGYDVGSTPNANPAGTIQPMPIQELAGEEGEEKSKDIEEELVVSDESKVSVTSPLSSVIKIASKFRGPSKIETQAEFLHRQREFTEKQRLIAKAIAQYQLTSQSVEKSGSLKPPLSSSSPSDTHIHYPLNDEEGEVDHNPVENNPLERNGMEIENLPQVADVSIREESYQDDQIHELPVEENETESMLFPGHHPFSDVEPKQGWLSIPPSSPTPRSSPSTHHVVSYSYDRYYRDESLSRSNRSHYSFCKSQTITTASRHPKTRSTTQSNVPPHVLW